VDIEAAYEKYRADMVRAMTAFSRDAEAAEDGVSGAYLQALIHREELEGMPEPAMKAWLYAAARNSVIDIKRREKRLTSFHDDDPDLFPPGRKIPADRTTRLLSRCAWKDSLTACAGLW